MSFRFPFLLLTLLFPNQVSDNNVSVAIRFLVVVSENVLAIAVTENVVIYEEEGVWLWIGYPLNMGNILEYGDLQTFVGCTEFDVPFSFWFSVDFRGRVATGRSLLLTLSETGFTGLEDLQDYLACYSVLFSFFIFCRFLNAILRLLRAFVQLGSSSMAFP